MIVLSLLLTFWVRNSIKGLQNFRRSTASICTTGEFRLLDWECCVAGCKCVDFINVLFVGNVQFENNNIVGKTLQFNSIWITAFEKKVSLVQYLGSFEDQWIYIYSIPCPSNTPDTYFCLSPLLKPFGSSSDQFQFLPVFIVLLSQRCLPVYCNMYINLLSPGFGCFPIWDVYTDPFYFP